MPKKSHSVELSDADKQAAKNLYNILDKIRLAYPKVDMQQIMMILASTYEDGISQQEIALRLKIPQPTVSRKTNDIALKVTIDPEDGSIIDRKGEGLVKLLQNEEDKKQLAIHLTGKGKRFIKSIIKEIIL